MNRALSPAELGALEDFHDLNPTEEDFCTSESKVCRESKKFSRASSFTTGAGQSCSIESQHWTSIIQRGPKSTS